MGMNRQWSAEQNWVVVGISGAMVVLTSSKEPKSEYVDR